jgi:hypothetical protein
MRTTFNHGDRVSCTIEGVQIDDARICIERNLVFICQDKFDGSRCQERFGYRWSWSLGDNVRPNSSTDWNDNNCDVRNIKLKHPVFKPGTKRARIAALRELKKRLVADINEQIKEIQGATA